MIHFSIDQWRAWAPGLTSAQDWQRWSRSPWHPTALDAQPDVSFLPAMQRRRLSRLARMVFDVAWPLAEGRPPLPLVFASRHGETPRTFAILSDLAQGEPLSPTQFSLSVHNAIIGLWSIQRGDTSEMTALAAEGDGFEHAALEAAALLAEGAPQVLLVIAEEQPPQAYAGWVEDVPFPYALALLLRAGDEWALRLDTGATAAPASWPHGLNFLRTLLNQEPHCQHPWKTRTWTWRRTP